MNCIVTFSNTTSAARFQREAERAGLAGKMIPTPRTLSASCGLAWCGQETGKEKVVDLMERCNIPYGTIAVMEY